MSSSHHHPLNPTVEEVNDEANGTPQQNSNAQRKEPSWSEVCSQHESILSAHLEMLQGVRNQVAADGDTFRLISSMVEKTNRLVTQFKVVKRQLMDRPTSPTSIPIQGAKMETPDNNDSSRRQDSTGGRKRLRVEGDAVQADVHEEEESARSQKRKRRDLVIPGSELDVRDVRPVSMETEDISEEVQRRLKIKEEQRKKRHAKSEKGDTKPEKRKRDSLASNGSAPSPGGASRPRRKKTKVGMANENRAANSSSQAESGKHRGRKRDSRALIENQTTSGSKRQRKTA